MAIRVVDICRYPVKGLSAERLERVALSRGEGLPHDRRFAIAHADVRFDPERPEWLPKTNFLMLMRDEKLARLRTRFDDESGTLTIERDGKRLVRAKITEPAGRARIGEFFAAFMADAARGAPKVLEAPGHTFSDASRKPGTNTYKYVSIVNLASVRELERFVGRPVDPIRFRANVYLDGAPAWAEFDWTGREIAVGGARLCVVSPIDRCAATMVNPTTAERDLNVPRALKRGFGHVDMGVYAEVIAGGEVAAGDAVDVAGAPLGTAGRARARARRMKSS